MLGLIKQVFRWSSIKNWHMGAVAALAAASAILLRVEQYSLAEGACAVATVAYVAKLWQHADEAHGQSHMSQVGFKVASLVVVGGIGLAVILGAERERTKQASAAQSDPTVNQKSGDSSPNISNVGGDVSITYGDGTQKNTQREPTDR